MINLIDNLNMFLKTINFKSNNDFKLIITFFTSKTCLPCQQIYNSIELLSKKYSSTTYFYKIEGTNSPDIFSYCNIKNIPSFNIYFKGKLLKNIVGDIEKLNFEIQKLINIIHKKIKEQPNNTCNNNYNYNTNNNYNSNNNNNNSNNNSTNINNSNNYNDNDTLNYNVSPINWSSSLIENQNTNELNLFSNFNNKFKIEDNQNVNFNNFQSSSNDTNC